MTVRIAYVCSRCGSDAVTLEGFIHWSAGEQKYEVGDLCDDGHSCSNCGGECHVEEIGIPSTAREALEALEGWASAFIEDWLSDESMSPDERKEARHADVRMHAAVELLRKELPR
jgi:hypothetical protein